MNKSLKIVAMMVMLLGGAAALYWGALEWYRSKSTLDWPHDLAAAKSRAAASDKPVLVKIGSHY